VKKRGGKKQKGQKSLRGKVASRMAGAGIVLLDPDVAEAFPDAKSVNRALRAIIEIAPAKRGKRSRA